MERTFWAPFVASLCAALITSLGIGVIRRYGDWATRNSPYFACFAAGVLIAVSFLHIIPKSLSLDRRRRSICSAAISSCISSTGS